MNAALMVASTSTTSTTRAPMTRPRASSISTSTPSKSRSAASSFTSSAAMEIAIDAYATRVIKRHSPADSIVDTSLAPYITALLRRAKMQDEFDIKKLPEYDSLLELLEDQCHMDTKNATTSLISISRAICTQMTPDDNCLASFTSLGEALKEAAEQAKLKLSSSPPSRSSSAMIPSAMISPVRSGRSGRSSSVGNYQHHMDHQDLFGITSRSALDKTPLGERDGTPLSTPSASVSKSRLTTIVTPMTSDHSGNDQGHEVNSIQRDANIQPYTPNPIGGPSPLKPDALIPVDLLGALDDPSPHLSRRSRRRIEEKEEAFPPLGASTNSKKMNRIKKMNLYVSHGINHVNTHSSSNGLGNINSVGGATGDNHATDSVTTSSSVNAGAAGNSSKHSKNKNKDLAAALFRPARPRQNSFSETASTPTSATASSSSSASGGIQTSLLNEDLRRSSPKTTDPLTENDTGGTSARNSSSTSRQALVNRPYFQQQLDSAVEILLSMNTELCEEAAKDAATMSKTDFNVAQYIVDKALSAPPICRHMLQDGCYRSDCAFSHDVEGHTCLFWLRGRCGKGANCKFKHGFNPKLLDGIKIEPHDLPSTNIGKTTSLTSTTSSPSPLATVPKPGTTQRAFANPYGSPMLSSSAPSKGGFLLGNGGFSLTSSTRGSGANAGRGGDDGSFLSSSMASSWKTSPQRESILRSFSPSNEEIRRPSTTTSVNSTKKTFSFANIASQGCNTSTTRFANKPSRENHDSLMFFAGSTSSSSGTSAPTVRIPQDLWNPHENRDASAFYVPDPIDRYNVVAKTVKRSDVIDLHFQSTKKFGVVLSKILPDKLSKCKEIWVVTGTGHHVGSKTHQKSGGALERAVIGWLEAEGYTFARGKDRNGIGGAVLVKAT